ncbi:hypothetical protein EVAR_62324_1 [Eumeta japonica]|uniref:Uncharacterized protein n=1 Tax=Eumeta variegata TaxID=151549 RepID=A0A4C1Z7D6_EUMVA|nr:hypothetical protein EVAR_62324_1 [Eumeta japonica]
MHIDINFGSALVIGRASAAEFALKTRNHSGDTPAAAAQSGTAKSAGRPRGLIKCAAGAFCAIKFAARAARLQSIKYSGAFKTLCLCDAAPGLINCSGTLR